MQACAVMHPNVLPVCILSSANWITLCKWSWLMPVFQRVIKVLKAFRMLQIYIARCQDIAFIHSFPTMYGMSIAIELLYESNKLNIGDMADKAKSFWINKNNQETIAPWTPGPILECFGTANFNSHSCDKVLPVLDQSDEECKHSMGNILQLTWSFLELVASYDFQRHSHLGKPGKSGNFSQIGDTPPSPNPHWGILPFIFGHLHLLKAEEKIPPCFDKIPTFSDFILSRWERRP